MKKRAGKPAEESSEHGDEAVRLLKMSVQIHEAEKQGLIDEIDAADIAVELNKQAIAKMDKAIESQKEFLAGQDRE